MVTVHPHIFFVPEMKRTRSVEHTDSRDDDGPPRDLKEEKIGIARRKEEGGW